MSDSSEVVDDVAQVTPPAENVEAPVDNGVAADANLRGMIGQERDVVDTEAAEGDVPVENTFKMPDLANDDSVKEYLNNITIDNTDVYGDLVNGDEDFADLPDILKEHKILPQQIKPLIDYWNGKIMDRYNQSIDDGDYDAKVKQALGDGFEAYNGISDELIAKYVPAEYANDVKNASNNVLVTMKAVVANIVKEHDAKLQQVYKDYDVDPSKYKATKLQDAQADAQTVQDLTRKIFTLSKEGKIEEASKLQKTLLNKMGFTK